MRVGKDGFCDYSLVRTKGRGIDCGVSFSVVKADTSAFCKSLTNLGGASEIFVFRDGIADCCQSSQRGHASIQALSEQSFVDRAVTSRASVREYGNHSNDLRRVSMTCQCAQPARLVACQRRELVHGVALRCSRHALHSYACKQKWTSLLLLHIAAVVAGCPQKKRTEQDNLGFCGEPCEIRVVYIFVRY
jgi:hypothetical protein